MSGFRANSIVNRDGTGAPNFPNGIVATGATFTGGISGVNGTFSGNLTIGGTVSYQEVENIDAVGVITAQQGIQVEANGLTVTGVGTFNNPIKVVGVTTVDANGLNVAGVITATTLKGSGANLTGVLPTTSAVASGSISNGQPVILQSDGTVTKIVQTQEEVELNFPGSASQINTNDTSHHSIVYDSDQEIFLLAFKDNNVSASLGKARTIVFNGSSGGSEVPIPNTDPEFFDLVYDPSTQRCALMYINGDSGNNPQVVVGVVTASGKTVHFGSPTTIESVNASTDYAVQSVSLAYDSNNEKIVACYVDNNNQLKVGVGTINPTANSISFGTLTTVAETTKHPTLVYDANAQKTIALSGVGGELSGRVGTISGTSISFGSATTLNTDARQIQAAYDSTAQKILIVYRVDNNSDVGEAVVGTVSGTSISFGSAYRFGDYGAKIPRVQYYAPTNLSYIAYMNLQSGNNTPAVRRATITGTAVTFGTIDNAWDNTTDTPNMDIAIDVSNRSIEFFGELAANNGAYAVGSEIGSLSTNLTANNFLGFSNAAYTDGQTATIQITGSVDDAQSGLTTARKHYVQNDGTLGITTDDPIVPAGVAISATEIIVKG